MKANNIFKSIKNIPNLTANPIKINGKLNINLIKRKGYVSKFIICIFTIYKAKTMPITVF